MKLLFATSEIFPLSKTGGLGDVCAALPKALADLGVDARIVTPAYPSALAAVRRLRVVAPLNRGLGGRILLGETPDSGLPVYLIDAPHLYNRIGGPYLDLTGEAWPDNAERFGLLSHVTAALGCGDIDRKWTADVILANDWPTGLVPAVLHARAGAKPAVVFTIHNLAFQGLFAPTSVSALDLDPSLMSVDGLEFYGNLSFMKGGIRFADRIVTVSPGYAREILTPEYGCGLEGALQARADALSGIINGADLSVWNPSTDPLIPARYSASDLSGKVECKRLLQEELGLAVDPHKPIFVMLSRLTEQKMADIVASCAPEIVRQGGQFVTIASGDRRLESDYAALAQAHPGQCAIRIGYDETLAHRALAGSDVLLAPARFEPCGLTAMYGSLYGALPLGRRTGGLSTTIVDLPTLQGRTAESTGFLFDQPTADGLMDAVQRALGAFERPLLWRQMQTHGMSRDFSWRASAQKYLDLCRQVTDAEARVEPAEQLAALN